ncbi:MAG: hypothetical protein JST08_01770 [Actinobacteria bacterium]|nr:hypothetical protein [Actinomycetota bacterium]
MLRLRFAVTLILVLLLGLALAAAAAGKKAAPLSVSAPKAASLSVGVPTKVKVKVANRGPGPIAGVVLLAKGSRQVKVKPAKATVGTLKAHKAKSVSFTVTATATAGPKLRFLATAPNGMKARDGVALKVAPGAKKEAPKKEEAKKVPDIVGRYFWNSEYLITTYVHGYYVVDEHWIYRGIPKEGPPACSGQTANGDEDGCLPYTWNEETGALTVGGEGGEYKVGSHIMKVGSKTFEEAVMPEAGARFDASGSYINQYGICPISCTFVTIDLQMSSNGEFARASGVAGFFGEGGSYGALPPTSHGTYAVDPRGRITFSYADGHTATETIGIMLDGSNNPDPNYGLVLGSSIFLGPHSKS